MRWREMESGRKKKRENEDGKGERRDRRKKREFL